MLTCYESAKVSMEWNELCLYFIKSNDENAVSHRYVVAKEIRIAKASFAIDGYSYCLFKNVHK